MKKAISMILMLLMLVTVFVPIRTEAATAETILNSAKLNPLKTGYPTADDKIKDIFDEILTDKMSTYDKVKACYDYIMTTVSYKNSYECFDSAQIKSIQNTYNFGYYYDAKVTYYGYALFKYGYGVCDNYSCAFLLMARAIGLDAYYMRGTGSYGSGHAWVNIIINGTYYTFDPQADQTASKNNGKLCYYRFCKTDAEMSKYLTYDDRAADIAAFHNFEKTTDEPTALSVKFSSSVSEGKIPYGTPVTLTAEAVGGVGGYGYEIYEVKGNVSELPASGYTVLTNEAECVWTARDGGDYTIFAVVKDERGIKAQKTLHFTVEQTLPEITGFTISQKQFSTVGFTATLKLTATPVGALDYLITVEHNGSVHTISSEATAEWTPQENGVYIFTATVFDNAGNMAQATLTYTVLGGEGDINGDGQLTLADAMLMFAYVAGMGELTDEQQTVADMDKNGQVTLADCMQVFGIIAGATDNL